MGAVLLTVWGEPYEPAEAGTVFAPPPGPVIPPPPDDRARRNPGWAPLLKGLLAPRPPCRGCGRLAKTGHHVKPFGKFPGLELAISNIALVCVPCHFVICHAGDWRTYVVDCLRQLDRHRLRVAAALPIEDGP